MNRDDTQKPTGSTHVWITPGRTTVFRGARHALWALLLLPAACFGTDQWVTPAPDTGTTCPNPGETFDQQKNECVCYPPNCSGCCTTNSISKCIPKDAKYELTEEQILKKEYCRTDDVSGKCGPCSVPKDKHKDCVELTCNTNGPKAKCEPKPLTDSTKTDGTRDCDNKSGKCWNGTCCTGCWDGTTCILSKDTTGLNKACGIIGQTCKDCVSSEKPCYSGKCDTSNASKYKCKDKDKKNYRGDWTTCTTTASLQGNCFVDDCKTDYWTTIDDSTTYKNDINGVWGTSATNVYMVGDNATVLHYNGSTWSDLSKALTWSSTPPSTLNFYDVGGTAKEMFLVGTGGYGASRTVDTSGKVEWKDFKVSTDSDLRGVWSFNNMVIAVGDNYSNLANLHERGSTGWTFIKKVSDAQPTTGKPLVKADINLLAVWGPAVKTSPPLAYVLPEDGVLIARGSSDWISGPDLSAAPSLLKHLWGIEITDNTGNKTLTTLFVVGSNDYLGQVENPTSSIFTLKKVETLPSRSPAGTLHAVWGTPPPLSPSTDTGHLFAVGTGGLIVHCDISRSYLAQNCNRQYVLANGSPVTEDLYDVWGVETSTGKLPIVLAVGAKGRVVRLAEPKKK